MYSKQLLKDIQQLISEDVKFSKSSLSYLHHMVVSSSSLDEKIAAKLKDKIRKIHRGINKELIRLGLDKLRAKHPEKHDFTIEQVYQELLALLFPEIKISWVLFKAVLDRAIKKVVNTVKVNLLLLTAFKPPPDKLEQHLFLSIQSRSVNG